VLVPDVDRDRFRAAAPLFLVGSVVGAEYCAGAGPLLRLLLLPSPPVGLGVGVARADDARAVGVGGTSTRGLHRGPRCAGTGASGRVGGGWVRREEEAAGEAGLGGGVEVVAVV
jgi:hypothetical protein